MYLVRQLAASHSALCLIFDRQFAGLPWIWIYMDILMYIILAHLLIKLNTTLSLYNISLSVVITLYLLVSLCYRVK